MPSWLTRSHTLVLPLVILVVVLAEELIASEMRRLIPTVEGRTAATMVLNAVAFSFAAEKVSPWLKRVLVRLRSTSRRGAGRFGVWLFFAAAYGALYAAFLRLERFGPPGLLPGP